MGTAGTGVAVAATMGMDPGETIMPGVVAMGVTVPVGVEDPAPETAGPEGSRFIGLGLMRAKIGLP